MIPSVNYHLWEPCNMRCQFCFATFQDVKQSILPKGHLSREKSIKLVQELANCGFEKITFAGGEPTLCPWLFDLIKTAKSAGMTTMIVTNGSRVDDDFLIKHQKYLDWIAISVDSLDPLTNYDFGRAISGKRPLSREYYYSLVEQIKRFGYGLKINTVVNRKNYTEDMNDFIQYSKPDRWKVLQVLPIEGQNNLGEHDLEIGDAEFQQFLDVHKRLNKTIRIVSETNEQMKGSYAMVDPAGRFFDNSTGKHRYSKPILLNSAKDALNDVEYDIEKFLNRGGKYDWQIEKRHLPSKITISGEVASGKSTIGKLLATKLNYNYKSIGERTRRLAESKGKTILEFQKYCLQNPEFDKQIDLEFSDECNGEENIVIDYRLGFKFINNDAYHIFLKVSEDTAIERLKSTSRRNETYSTLKERNEHFKQQFENNYGVQIDSLKHYDCVIETENKLPEEIIEIILEKISTYAYN